MGEDLVLVVELDAEHRTRKNGRNSAFEFNRFFAAHAYGAGAAILKRTINPKIRGNSFEVIGIQERIVIGRGPV
jgi:hypothetical protein